MAQIGLSTAETIAVDRAYHATMKECGSYSEAVQRPPSELDRWLSVFRIRKAEQMGKMGLLDEAA